MPSRQLELGPGHSEGISYFHSSVPCGSSLIPMPNTITTLPLFLAFFGYVAFPVNSFPPAQEKTNTRYVNCDFGYLVRVPSGFVARIPEYQRHGFSIDLPDGESTIEIYNAYNMSDSVSPRKVFDYELEGEAEGRPGWRIASRHDEQIKGLAATRVTATYRYKGAQWKSLYVILYRPLQSDGEGNIVYSLELSAPLARYQTTSAELDIVLGGFELTKIPHGPSSNN